MNNNSVSTKTNSLDFKFPNGLSSPPSYAPPPSLFRRIGLIQQSLQYSMPVIAVFLLASCQGQKMNFTEANSSLSQSQETSLPSTNTPAGETPTQASPAPTQQPGPSLPTIPTPSLPPAPSPSPAPSPVPSPSPVPPPVPSPTLSPAPPAPPAPPSPSPFPNPSPVPSATPSPSPSPTPIVTQPIPDPTLKTGLCSTNGQKLLSCLPCQFPPPPAPLLSAKAQRLAEIMWRSCPLPNGSDPAGYVAPTRTQMYDKVSACSPTAYPESPLTRDQAITINRLMTETEMNKLLFTGFWYHRPFTEHFENYFGLDNREARYTFCNGDRLSGTLITKEYIDECALSEDNCWAWSQNAKKVAAFNAAQEYRRQLIACMKISKGSPTAPKPPTPNCSYKSFDGYYDIGGREFVNELLSNGYIVAMETQNSCAQLTSAPVPTFTGPVKIVGYKCE